MVVRTVLALLVVASHAPALLTGENGTQPLTLPVLGNLGDMAVNAFLALSGYYVTASALRHRGFASFARARAARLLPALWLHAIAGILVAGAVLSAQGPIRHLLTEDVWRDALRSSLGMWRDYAITGSDGVLQGVFASNPNILWNEPLWTIKYEIYCYAISGGLAMIAPALDGRRRILWMSGVIMLAPAVGRAIAGVGDLTYMPWERLPACYAMGSIAFLAGARGRVLSAACGASALMALAFSGNVGFQPFAWMAAGSSAIALSRLPLQVKLPDASYGIYIWAWPTSQALIAHGLATRDALTLWAATSIIAGAIALLSWSMVESPMRRLMRASP